MDLSLPEAATVLGKSERQVRYLVKTGRLAARKEGGRWRIASADLPLTDAQRQALASRLQVARQAFEDGLQAASKATGETENKRHYSVKDLAAFAAGADILRQLRAELSEADPARRQLSAALELLSRGCHCFHPTDKARRFTEAREAAASAVAELLLAGAEEEPARVLLADRLEQELIPQIAGLVALHERRSRRSRFDRFNTSSLPS